MSVSKQDSFWVRCPVCGGKTRIKVLPETVFYKLNDLNQITTKTDDG